MITEPITVVRCINDNHLVKYLLVAEGVHDTTYLIVNEVYHRVVIGDYLTLFRLGHLAPVNGQGVRDQLQTQVPI